jgi:hypothetical protein
MRDFEVSMVRKRCLNANEAARKCVAYVRAVDAAEAMKLAAKLPHRAAFKAMSAREVK